MHPQSAHDPPPSVPEQWLARISCASTPDDLVEVAREYVAEMTEAERMRLPSSCLPPPFKTARDVNDYALTLTRAHLQSSGSISTAVLIDRLMVFFATVSARLAQIQYVSRARI
jgi:hypothetical protein